MSEIQVCTPAELPQVLDGFAAKTGGRVYREGEIDEFAITREITSRRGSNESYIKFGVQRLRDEDHREVVAVQYAFEQGTSTKLEKGFSKPVRQYLAEMCIMVDPEQIVWQEEVETYSFANDFEEDERLIIATRDMRYGVGRQHLFEVPILNGQPMFTGLEELDPPAALRPVVCTPEVTVLENTQSVDVLEAGAMGDFEAIMQSFSSDKLERCLERMATMMALLIPD